MSNKEMELLKKAMDNMSKEEQIRLMLTLQEFQKINNKYSK
ncbi:hypothetical protein [Clostridium beijerinckii]|nr:hypothetical protein [Clostridium beijerinckii]NRU52498.1 hypothetical protein [Clostridium beijerinckii]NYC69057.1 hypothetical protein [Clostridium beijerinckii]NYC91699.1 hypothetical protein [Clostridium beijerinckii]